MNTPNDLRDTFFLEAEDLLDQMAEGLRALDEGAETGEVVNSIFRAVHSIKGGAGAFKLDLLVGFAHQFETLLDELRDNRLELTQELLRVMHHGGDHLSDMVAAERDGDDQNIEKTEALKAEITALLPEQADGGDAEISFQPMQLSIGPVGGLDLAPAAETQNRFELTFVPHDALYSSGNDPRLLLRDLAEFGEMDVSTDLGIVPDLDTFEFDKSYLTWKISLTTSKDEADIRQVFEFVETSSELSVEALSDPEPRAEPAAAPTPAEIDVTSGISKPTAPPANPPTEPSKPAGPAQARAKPKPIIRVDLDRVDRLINLVGELIIHQAMLTQVVDEAALASGSEIMSALDELRQLSRDIQESVMAIRAQPVKPLFERMYRIVREAGEASGKSVKLDTEGEMTEVDKTVVERLADPLTHMVRNAVDHGLEKPEDRVANGKPEQGRIVLSAGHRSGRVMISISDDGGGINRERVLSIAKEKGLIPEDAELSDTEIDNLLFLPGFSTAKEVSSLSGRGVGMDVVKSAIQALGGRISITSNPGKGSTFSISLPLTLAVLDGMVVDVAGQQMVVPITTIIETLRPTKETLMELGPDSRVVSVRGTYVPILDVANILGFREPVERPIDKVALLVETEDEQRAAFLVDNIHDQRQVVIKSLHENYGEIPGVAAATVFGDGRVALILDPGNLIAANSSQTSPAIGLQDANSNEVQNAAAQ